MYQASKISPNVWCLDTGYLKPRYTAAYLLIDNNQVALIDCGINSSISLLLSQINTIGINPEQITALCLTHAHLDHAGSAGLIVKSLPNATVYAHKDTIRHLVKPENLERGVRAVYGDEFFEKIYGTIYPLDESLCQSMQDGESITLDTKKIMALYTPGHAWHHLTFFCEQLNTIFAGDAFGLSIKISVCEPNLHFPATPPSQFAPEAMIESFEKIIATNAKSILVAHYGEINQPERASKVLTTLVHQSTDLILKHHAQDMVSLKNLWLKMCHKQTKHTSSKITLDDILEKFDDTELNVSGLLHWHTKNSKIA